MEMQGLSDANLLRVQEFLHQTRKQHKFWGTGKRGTPSRMLKDKRKTLLLLDQGVSDMPMLGFSVGDNGYLQTLKPMHFLKAKIKVC